MCLIQLDCCLPIFPARPFLTYPRDYSCVICSNSDIWRDFPRFLIPVFEIIYLNNYQGSQTSVAAALCDWRHLRSDSSSTDMVYLQPYYQLFAQRKGEPLFPSLELVGVFGGHLSATPRLPRHDGGLQAAKALWTASLNATSAKWPDSS